MMQVQSKHAINQATPQEAVKEAAWIQRQFLPLQLHCVLTRIRKPQQPEIVVQAEPSHSMSLLLKFLKWTLPTSGLPTMSSISKLLES